MTAKRIAGGSVVDDGIKLGVAVAVNPGVEVSIHGVRLSVALGSSEVAVNSGVIDEPCGSGLASGLCKKEGMLPHAVRNEVARNRKLMRKYVMLFLRVIASSNT